MFDIKLKYFLNIIYSMLFLDLRGGNILEVKKHFKLYKSGKQWITAAVATVALSAGMVLGGVAHADTTTPADNQSVATTQPVGSQNKATQDSTQGQTAANNVVPDLLQHTLAAATNNNTQNASDLNAQKTQQSQSYNHDDNGSYGNFDSVAVDGNQLHVTGWQATNKAAQYGTDNRYLIVVGHNDQGQQEELGRTKLTSDMIVNRPDVQKAHNVYNAANSGFNANVQLDVNKLQNYRNAIQIISRYSKTADGNGFYDGSDYVSQPVTFDKNNYAYLDQMAVVNSKLHVAGWNATNDALGKANHYVILYDQTQGRELARVKVNDQSRPDVANAHKDVINANNSGFAADFSLNGVDLTHQLQVISRYSDAANGEGNHVDYWFAPQALLQANLTNQGNLDQFNVSKAGEVTVTGWHATDASNIERNHFLILFDQTANRQVASIKVDTVARPDVAKVYPNVKSAGQSGFSATFKVKNGELAANHQYAIVSRYSAVADGNGDSGNHTDYWSNGVKLNQSAYWLDHLKMTDQGLHISGWVASDNSLSQPHAFAFVMNNGKEVARQELKLAARPDVANAYPSLYNSAMSGFDTTIKLDNISKLTGNLQVLLRFTNNKNGDLDNGQATDQYSKNYATAGHSFDYVKANGNTVQFAGWDATDQAINLPYQWMIVLVNGQEAARQLISSDMTDGLAGFDRTDVYKVFPEVANSAMSGFQGTMTIPVAVKNGDTVQLVHRFADSSTDAEKQYIQSYSPVLTVNNGSAQLGQYALRKFGLQKKDGKDYYYDPTTGQVRKNFLMQTKDGWEYFDNDTGAGTDALKLQFDKGTVSLDRLFDYGNKAYDFTSKSIENVNGYLTADTWYRPAKILANGTTWTDSKDTDYRPLLMSWWPNKQIQVDYLNYMKKQGYVSNSQDYTVNDGDYTLNYAAEDIQRNFEKRIAQNGTDWLKQLINDFIKTEPIWNEKTENVNYSGLQFQGGFLKYENSKLTPYANSDYRLLGRMPINIDGKGYKGAEFLLANDVDNSNPVVQAEQLNWLYYLLNFGTITGNNDQANFDSVRVDAPDNIDADLMNIAKDYFNAAYGMNSDAVSNKHINILEDWNSSDPNYFNKIGNPQLTMDVSLKGALNHGLSDSKNRWGLNAIVYQSLANRANDSTENEVIPNYSFIRAHDNNSQDQIQNAIRDLTGKDYHTFTQADEKKGIDAYIKDQNSTVKKYNLYNIPSSYAILLTNKDTIPRVYYGDLYTDGGQYMEHRTRYYDTLTNLLKSRVKYVSGGQSMQTMSIGGNNNVLTSVRYGKGAMKATDSGTAETRTQGIGVVVSNDQNLKLGANDTVVLHMGAAHKHQEYRAAVLTTDNGVVNYTSDQNAPVAYTNANGDLYLFGRNLIINGQEEANTAVKGYANPDVSGYLAVWVPVGASDNQDARTAPSTEKNDGKSAYRSNAAFDSNVIFEAFSNFVYTPTKESERANVRIAQNADFFASLGFTSFEMAPQYNSSKARTFLDSTIDNGYAFTDRYDLGMSAPNKYGTDADLRNAIQALHKAGLQVMADWVPDQIYNLPGKEVVTVSRGDDHGNAWKDSMINNDLYVANTIGGGEYQKKYGGAFLDQLQKLYPELFTKKQVSTGVPIDPSVKITEWSAKYFNGTNILHRGSGYVLKADGGQYYNLGTTTKQFLPSQLTGVKAQDNEGFVKGADGSYYFYNLDGQMVKNTFIQDSTGNWYFFGQDGKMVENQHFVNVDSYGTSGTYFFLNNGVSFRSGLVQTNDGTYYFDNYGRLVRNQVITVGAMTYTIDQNGKIVKTSYNPDADRPVSTDIGQMTDQNRI